jgi:hypothetical protein
MSQALLQLINPYLDEDTQIDEARALAFLGSVAWNLAAAPDVGEEEHEGLRSQLAPALGECLDRVLRHLRRRKRELFPGDRRVIVHTDVHGHSDGSFFVTAAVAAH